MARDDFAGLVKSASAEAALLDRVDFTRVPVHVAIIMDGNGRWAKKRGMPRIEGHRRGVEAVREAVETARRLGVKVLTLYAFSTENWKRPRTEVRILFNLLSRYVKSEMPLMLKNDIRFTTIGHVEDLPQAVQDRIALAREKTAHCRTMTLNVALSYSGRTEILDAVQAVARDVAAGRIAPEAVDRKAFEARLATAGLPDPDLLVRTSGEMRISNFLLWQVAYAEIVVLPVLWPDFRRRHFFEALLEYQGRERRYGGVDPSTGTQP